jgi:23S rRNA pseudouridine2457 synthase
VRSGNIHLQYILFYKPFGVLSQFTREGGHTSLRDFGPFLKGVYPAGRLDADSEGLLLLTNDNLTKHRLTDPAFRHERTYLVQVERIPSETTLQKLREGIPIEGRKTLPAKVIRLLFEPPLPPRPVPIRYRKNVATCWLEFRLIEGRNRQIRKMTAAIGHPTLRLVRTQIGSLSIEGLKPGESRSLLPREVHRLRNILGIHS